MSDSTPRISLVDDAGAPPALRATFDRVEGAMGRVPNLYRTLGHSPDVLDAWLAFAWPLRHVARTDRSVRELVIMRTAQLTGAEYEWRQHWTMALESGVTEDQLAELHEWPTSEAFSPLERAALRMTDELSSTSDLGEDAWRELRSLVDERECVELVLTAAFYQCVSRVLRGLRVPLEADAATRPALDPTTSNPHVL